MGLLQMVLKIKEIAAWMRNGCDASVTMRKPMGRAVGAAGAALQSREQPQNLLTV